MKLKSISPLLAALALAVSATSAISLEENTEEQLLAAGNAKFVCNNGSETPVTQMTKGREERVLIKWSESHFSSSRAEELCPFVAEQLQGYYNDGQIGNEIYLSSIWKRGKTLICVETEGDCATLFSLGNTPGQALKDLLPNASDVSDSSGDEGVEEEDNQVLNEGSSFRRRARYRFWW